MRSSTPGLQDVLDAISGRTKYTDNDDGRLHIPKGEHEAIGEEVRQFAIAAIRRRAGAQQTDPREVCNQCITNALGEAVEAQLKQDLKAKDSRDVLAAGVNFATTFDHLRTYVRKLAAESANRLNADAVLSERARHHY